jgi:hypothetical protein
MNASVTIRYVGQEDFCRRFLLERQDGLFHTGRGWTAQLAKARMYDTLAAAQKVYRTIMTRKYGRRERWEFTLRLDLTVFGDVFSRADLRDYLARTMQVNFDNAAAGDGPGGSFVMARAVLGTLDEVKGTRPDAG